MDYHALVIRNGDRALLSSPTTICRSWHPTEDPDLEGDDKELAVELDLHERGYRMCQCYSRFEPEGEFGHMTEARLLAIPQADFQEALVSFTRTTCRSTRSASTTPLLTRIGLRLLATNSGPAGSRQDDQDCWFHACCLDWAVTSGLEGRLWLAAG